MKSKAIQKIIFKIRENIIVKLIKEDIYFRFPKKFNLSSECKKLPAKDNILAIEDYEYIEYLFQSDMKNKYFVVENGFLRSATTWTDVNAEPLYKKAVSFLLDKKAYYFDAKHKSDLEELLNDKNLIITEEQKQRARACIDKIVANNLTKYNHQPIFEPKIGREGVKKILVADQSYGDASIRRGLADDNTFSRMLKCAIEENPDADILVKTHPDTIANRESRSGYYVNVKSRNNVYTMTEAINPISLLKYVDKVYVCTTQLGFEALMCGKEVHVFGMPFYAGWGATCDRQKLKRRKNSRTVEEIFYIMYIIYTKYVNPKTKSICEIEETIDYLLELRKEYFSKKMEITSGVKNEEIT